jgi:hypothetical protein
VAHLTHSDDSETNDVELFFPGNRYPVIVGPDLRQTGWRGGQFVMYVADDYDFTVEVSDGTKAAGFLLFPSENYNISWENGGFLGGDGVGSNANWTSGQPATGVGGQNVVTMINDGTRAFFKVFETIALAGGTRSGGAITYTHGERLKVSENGLLCNDSDAALALAGIADPVSAGIVSAVPSSLNGNRLGADVKI